MIFGRPIGQNQGLAFPLADSHARLHAAELVIREASWRYDSGLDCGAQANLAEIFSVQAAFECADRAMQTHGGFGYAKEYDVERYWRESRLMKSLRKPRNGAELRLEQSSWLARSTDSVKVAGVLLAPEPDRDSRS